MLTERDVHVLALVQRAMLDGADEITLTDADIEALTVGDPTAIVPPARLELGVSIHATSAEAMNRGEFELRIIGAPRTHTSMAGRFAYLLDAADRDQLARTYTAGQSRAVILAQLSFPPRRVHNENVARVDRLATRVISVGEHPDGDVISVDHLAVTADADQLYLIHAPTGQRVVAYIANALAAVQMPPFARFLAEVGDARTAVFGPLDLGAAAAPCPTRPASGSGARCWPRAAGGSPPPISPPRGRSVTPTCGTKPSTGGGSSGASRTGWSCATASIGLEILAWTAAAAGDHERAARLLGAGQALKRRDGASFADVGSYREHHAQCARDARDALGEAAYAAAFEAGSRCTLEEAVSHALGGHRTRHMPSRRPTRPGGDLLTRREEQIAALVAQGLTNGDIATQLFISPRTAESHVDHILTKLGFTSRAQIAKWVAERR